MVEFFVSNHLDCNIVFEKLKKRRGNGKRQIIVVPDRFMLYYEKAVMDYLEIDSCFDIEVTSFSRMANKAMGDEIKYYLSTQSAIMLLRKVIEENKDKLSCFRGAYNNADFASEIYAVISQIRNSGVSTDKIEAILPDLPAKILNKSKDIVLLYKEYIAELTKKYTDGSSKLEALVDYIAQNGMEECDVYITDYLYLTTLQRRICEQVFKNAGYCAVFMVNDDSGENKRIYPAKCLKKLQETAYASGCVANTFKIDNKLTGDKAVISRELFSYSGRLAKSDGFTQIYALDSYEGEVKRIAREIKYKVNTQNYRFKDFAVVCCDTSIYAPIIQKVFEGAGINYFFDKKQPMSTQAISRLILGVLKTVAKGFKRSDVVEFAKNAIFALDYSKVCAFENFCIKYGIDNNRFLNTFEIGKIDPDYACAEEIRRYVSAIFNVFDKKTATAREFSESIDLFLQIIDFEKLYSQYFERLAINDCKREYACAEQALDKIRELISQSVIMLGDCRLNISSYYNILNSAVASQEISLVPLYIDAVFVGESRESRYDNVRDMYVVGANAGKLPPEHGDDGIFASKESKIWSSCGVDIEPDAKEQNNAERLNTLMFLLKPKDSLQISYSKFSDKGEKLSESIVVRQLTEIFNLEHKTEEKINPLWSDDDYMRYFAGDGNVMDELLHYKFMVQSGILHMNKEPYDVLYKIACDKHGEEFVNSLLCENKDDNSQIDTKFCNPWKDGHTSASQLEKYMKCPFAHYMEYFLKVKERERAELKVSDVGSIIHEVLQEFFMNYDYKTVEKSQIASIVAKILSKVFEKDEYSQMLLIPYLKGEIQEIKQRCTFLIQELCVKMQCGDFEPYVFEEAFGMGGKFNPIQIKLKDKNLQLLGRIDRIDKYGDYITIIDYKTASSIAFSCKQVMYGDRIQLFVYMKALTQNGYKPGGVFYLPLNNKFVKEEDATGRFKFVGIINDSGNIVNHLDRIVDQANLQMQQEEGAFSLKSCLYPFKVDVSSKKKLSIKASDGGTVVDEKQFYKICDYVGSLIEKSAQEIDDGFIKPSPRQGACEYCGYADICGFNIEEDRTRKGNALRTFEKYSYFAEDKDNGEME